MLDEIEQAANEVQSIADDEGFKSIEGRIESEVLEYIDEQELTVAFLGEFSVGKSSLLNGVLDTNVLPIKVKPTTSLVTEIRRGPEEYVLRRDGTAEPIDRSRFEDLAEGVESTDPSDVVEMYIENGLIGDRNCFVDTPGVNSMNSQHQGITYRYVPQSDAACIVLDGNQGEVPKSVLQFLDDQVLEGDISKLVFAVNKLDELPSSNRDRVVKKIRSTLSDYLKNPRVIPTSANLEDMHRDDPGVAGLREVINEDILPRREEILSERASALLKNEINELIDALQTKAEGLESSTEELDERIDSLKEAREEVQRRLRRLEDEIRREMRRIRETADSNIRSMLRDVSSKAEQAIRSAKPAQLESLNLQQKISGWVGRGFEKVIRQDIEPRIKNLGEDIQERLDELKTDITGLNVDVSRDSTAISTALDIAVEGAMIVALNILLPGEWIAALLGRVLGGDLLKKVKKPIIDALKELFGGLSRAALINKVVEKVDGEVMGLQTDLSRQLRDKLESVEDDVVNELKTRMSQQIDQHRQALEAARRERDQKDKKTQREVQRLEEQIHSLRKTRSRLTD